MTASSSRTVIFDLGGVLIDWNPRYLYRRLFDGDEAAMEHFLAHVCSPDWNLLQDAGRTFVEAEAEAIARHPDKRHLIKAWLPNFNEMISGPITGTVEILRELRSRGTPLYALTNWSAETFVTQPARFEFLGWFQGIVVSGHEKITKPDGRIFRLLLERYNIDSAGAVFIDDAPRNVAGAEAAGIRGIHFTSPDALREELTALGYL
ncbi:MAG TPA: HAD family phosphatase [Rhodopila sp.]|nr:HAD family phosphatase [Rhodopila sp.]